MSGTSAAASASIVRGDGLHRAPGGAHPGQGSGDAAGGHKTRPYCGYYANRTRGERRKAEQAAHAAEGGDEATPTDTELPLGGVTVVELADFSRGDARRRWAELIRLIYEVDPLVCPKCGGTMRVIALIQEPKVIDKILKHLRAKGRDARAGPWATGPPAGVATAEPA